VCSCRPIIAPCSRLCIHISSLKSTLDSSTAVSVFMSPYRSALLAALYTHFIIKKHTRQLYCCECTQELFRSALPSAVYPHALSCDCTATNSMATSCTGLWVHAGSSVDGGAQSSVLCIRVRYHYLSHHVTAQWMAAALCGSTCRERCERGCTECLGHLHRFLYIQACELSVAGYMQGAV